MQASILKCAGSVYDSMQTVCKLVSWSVRAVFVIVYRQYASILTSLLSCFCCIHHDLSLEQCQELCVLSFPLPHGFDLDQATWSL